MRASVIVVSYNSVAYLHACLQSILANLGPDDELIVVDNGSTDGSAELVRTQFPEVRLLGGSNTGYAGGNNRGASVARGEYLVFLNPDTEVGAGALATLVAPLEAHTDIALTTACLVYMDNPDIVNACGNTVQYTGLAYCRGAGRARAQFSQGTDVDAVSGAAFAVRRTVFEQLGGFDEHFFMYVEDTDLSWRARLAGYRCWYVPDALVRHAYRPSYTPTKAFYLERNRYRMLLKCLHRRTLLRMLPGLALSELVTWGFSLINGPRYWGVKLRVYQALVAERDTLAAQRRGAQALRQRTDNDILRDLTYQLEFEQLAHRLVAHIARYILHPAFRTGRWFVISR